jgi:hypothetical protein
VVVPIGQVWVNRWYRRWEWFAVAVATAARNPARQPLISPVRSHASPSLFRSPKSQRRSPVLRVRGVRIDRTWPEWASTVAPHTVSWTTVGAVLAPLVLMGVFRESGKNWGRLRG